MAVRRGRHAVLCGLHLCRREDERRGKLAAGHIKADQRRRASRGSGSLWHLRTGASSGRAEPRGRRRRPAV